jgi:hypothetical protein
MVLSITPAAYIMTQSFTCQVTYRLIVGYLHTQLVLLPPTSLSVLEVADVKFCVIWCNTISHVRTYAIVARLVIGDSPLHFRRRQVRQAVARNA